MTNMIKAIEAVETYIKAECDVGVILTRVVCMNIYNTIFVVAGVRKAWRRSYVVNVETGRVFERMLFPELGEISDEQLVDAAVASWN